MRGYVFVFALLAAACTGCASMPSHSTAERTMASPDRALVYVWLHDAARDTALRVAGVDAIRHDGTHVPLEPRTVQVGRHAGTLDHLLASGAVTPGSYSGIEIRIEGAETVQAPVLFTAAQRQGVVLSVAVDSRSAAGAYKAAQVPRPAFGVQGVVASAGDSAVMLLDKRNGQVGGVVPTGSAPSGLALDRDRRRAYVVDAGDDSIAAIDLEQGTLAQFRAARGGDEPADVQLLPDGRALVVVNRGSDSISFVEPEGLAETDRVAVGAGPNAIAIDRLGARGFVFNSRGSSVSVVDLAAHQVLTTIAVEAGPLRGQFNRAQDRLWIVHDGTSNLTSIDPRTFAVVQRLFLGARAQALRVDPQGDRLYVARADGTGIDVYDPLSQVPTDTLRLAGRAVYLAIEGEGNNLCAVVPEQGIVRALGLVSRTPVWTAEVGSKPVYVTFVGER